MSQFVHGWELLTGGGRGAQMKTTLAGHIFSSRAKSTYLPLIISREPFFTHGTFMARRPLFEKRWAYQMSLTQLTRGNVAKTTMHGSLLYTVI